MNDTVLGLTANNGLEDVPTPLSETGVLEEYLLSALLVLTETSTERGPGAVGAKTAWKLMFLPASKSTGNVGSPEIWKLVGFLSVMALT